MEEKLRKHRTLKTFSNRTPGATESYMWNKHPIPLRFFPEPVAWPSCVSWDILPFPSNVTTIIYSPPRFSKIYGTFGKGILGYSLRYAILGCPKDSSSENSGPTANLQWSQPLNFAINQKPTKLIPFNSNEYGWWFRNPAPVQVGSLSLYLRPVFYISGGLFGIWAINSMIIDIQHFFLWVLSFHQQICQVMILTPQYPIIGTMGSAKILPTLISLKIN